MNYGELENIIIVVLDTALAIFKGTKKLRALVKKKTKTKTTTSSANTDSKGVVIV